MSHSRGRLLALALLAVVPPARAAAPEDFRFRKALTVTAGAQEVTAFALDRELYAATRPGYPDLRLFAADGTEVPYVLDRETVRRTRLVRQPVAGRVTALRELEGNRLEITVALAAEALPAGGLTFVTPLTDDERRVHVAGSGAGQDWQSLVTDALIFDYSRHLDLRNREVRLPANTARWLRVAVDAMTDTRESPLRELSRTTRSSGESEQTERLTVTHRPFRIDRLELWREVSTEVAQAERKQDYPVAGCAVAAEPAERSTSITVTTHGEPLTAFALATEARNFSRELLVLVPSRGAPGQPWRELGRATISRLDFHHQCQEQLRVEFPETREPSYRLVIRNRDNPPLPISGVTAEGNSYRVRFLATPNRQYSVSYGSPAVMAPDYETAAVLASVRDGLATDTATLGPETANTAYREARAGALSRLLGHQVTLGLVIGVMVVVLGWCLYRVSRPTADAAPSDPTS